MKEKLISIASSIVLILCLMSQAVFAASPVPIDSVDLTGLSLGDDWAGKTVSEVRAEIAGYSGYASQNLSFNTIVFADSNLQFLSDTDSFVKGDSYMIQLVLKSNEGYYFDNNKVVGSADADYLGTIDPMPLAVEVESTMLAGGNWQRSIDDTAEQMIYMILVYRVEAQGHVHEKGTYHGATEPTCEEYGTVEYWDCTGCDKKLDVDCNEITDIRYGDPLGHRFDDGTWKTSESEHWHPAICGHTEERGSVGSHEDSDKNHKCDVCGYVMSECSDENHDHICDYAGCGKTLSECIDENKDHICDYAGCGKTLSECIDENKDHICDYAGCGKTLSKCKDENKDHKCDYAGCGKVLSVCRDEDQDLVCDICGRDLSNPQTGDNRNIVLWTCLLVVSGTLLTLSAINYKKRKKAN